MNKSFVNTEKMCIDSVQFIAALKVIHVNCPVMIQNKMFGVINENNQI